MGAGLSRLTDATLEATLDVAGRAVRQARSLAQAPTVMAIVAMGRYGGFELSYGSDADVLFVHDPVPGADAQVASSYATAVANEVRRLLALPGADPALEVDADLRPEGKQGPLVRTLASYAAYYAKWSKVWEAQALLRADAVVGDVGLRSRFEDMIDPLRFPAGGLSGDDVREVRRTGCRAAPTRPRTSSSGAAGSPTSSGRCSCCSCATPAPWSPCARPAPSRRWRRRGTPSSSRPRTRRCSRTPGGP